jgi:hypothetical protein
LEVLEICLLGRESPFPWRNVTSKQEASALLLGEVYKNMKMNISFNVQNFT